MSFKQETKHAFVGRAIRSIEPEILAKGYYDFGATPSVVRGAIYAKRYRSDDDKNFVIIHINKNGKVIDVEEF